jgi:hypothetical protein
MSARRGTEKRTRTGPPGNSTTGQMQMIKVRAPRASTRRRNAISNAVRDRIVLDHLPLVKAIAIRVHENLPRLFKSLQRHCSVAACSCPHVCPHAGRLVAPTDQDATYPAAPTASPPAHSLCPQLHAMENSLPALSQYGLQYLLPFATRHAHPGCAHFSAFFSAMTNLLAPVDYHSGGAKRNAGW